MKEVTAPGTDRRDVNTSLGQVDSQGRHASAAGDASDASRPPLALAAAAAVMVVTFLVELVAPRTAAVHMFYAVPILLTWFVPDRRSTAIAACLATVLTLVGFWGAPGEATLVTIADHVMAIGLFLVVAVLLSYAKRLEAARVEGEVRLRYAHAELEGRVEARTAELRERADQLRRLASDLTLAEQRARENLAKVLHDGLQQTLYGVRLRLDRMVRGRPEGATASAELQRLRTDLDEAITATRALSVELSPPVLREQGLAAALQWLAGWMHDTHGLTVSLALDTSADPDSWEVRVLIFESIRELLFNVVKHANVSEALVELARAEGDQFRVTVRHGGAGFDVAAVNSGRPGKDLGLGLFTIRERLAMMGGRFEVESTPGHGASFTLVGPRGPHGPQVPQSSGAVNASVLDPPESTSDDSIQNQGGVTW